MKLFIDSANVEEIKVASTWKIISGVTTNPSLLAREGRKLTDVIQEITQLIDGPISAEVKEASAETMIEEAFTYAKMHPNITIKIPMTFEGLKAVKVLSAHHIQTNVTLVFSLSQAMMAARAGATYISPFLGRLDDYYQKKDAGLDLLLDIRDALDFYELKTKIIAASIRHTEHVHQAIRAGADIATIPYKVLIDMIKHPLTDKGLEIFKKASES